MIGYRRLLLGVASAVTFSGPALSAETPASNTARADAAEGLETIVVTAQRRAQDQQEVPIAITTVTADIAKEFGTVSTDSLARSVPTLNIFHQSGTGVTLFLRGVGSTESNGAESEVAVYVDDVYLGNPPSTDFQFNNIDSVEVLKGPQGTLFGRNATGGVIHLHTKPPSHDAAADVQVGYGSYDTMYGSVYATGGLSDTVAVSFAASGREQSEGYGKSLVTGEDVLKGKNHAFRGKLLWEPSEATSLLLGVDYNSQTDDAGTQVVIAPGTVAVGGGTSPADKFGTYNTPPDFQEVETLRGSAKLTHDFGALSLVSITAYTDSEQHFRLDLDGSPTGANIVAAQAFAPNEAFSQELQLQSVENEKFNWIIGAFYYDYEFSFDPQTVRGAAFAALGGSRNLFTTSKLKSYAGFADATYGFSDDTSLTAGVRYTRDEYDMDFRTEAANGTIAVVPHQSKTFTEPTWRLVLDHKITPDVMTYASYARGFKSGRFNVSDAKPVDPETLDAYELGIKSEFVDHRLRLNLAGFYYDYKDIQVTTTAVGISVVRNAGAAEIKGADLDLTFQPTKNFNITAGIAYLDTEYTAFPNGPLNVANPAACTPPPPHSTGAPTGGFTTCTVELKGNQLPRAPEFAMNLATTLTVPTGIGDIDFNASIYHNDGFFWEPDNQFAQDSYDLVNASVSWRSAEDKYEVQVYGRNLLDEYYNNFFSSGSVRAAGSPAMPINYGVTFTAHF